MSALRAASEHVAAFAWHKRSASTHATVVRDIQLIEDACDAMRELVVRDMRAAGWTWQEVGDALGTTHQAAMRRFKARGID